LCNLYALNVRLEQCAIRYTLNFDSLIEYLLIVTELVYVTEVANG